MSFIKDFLEGKYQKLKHQDTQFTPELSILDEELYKHELPASEEVLCAIEATTGNNVLHYAAASKALDASFYRFLIERPEISVKLLQQQNSNKETPIHIIVKNKDKKKFNKALRLLERYEQDLPDLLQCVKDEKGRSVEDIAKEIAMSKSQFNDESKILKKVKQACTVRFDEVYSTSFQEYKLGRNKQKNIWLSRSADLVKDPLSGEYGSKVCTFGFDLDRQNCSNLIEQQSSDVFVSSKPIPLKNKIKL